MHLYLITQFVQSKELYRSLSWIVQCVKSLSQLNNQGVKIIMHIFPNIRGQYLFQIKCKYAIYLKINKFS